MALLFTTVSRMGHGAILAVDERRNVYPLTRRQMADLPPSFYVAERVAFLLQGIVGVTLCAILLCCALASGFSY